MSLKKGLNAVESTKNICCIKGEGTVTRYSKKFRLNYKNLDDHSRSVALKTVTTEANQASSIWRVSGKLDISPSSVVRHVYNFGKNIWKVGIVLPVTKIFKSLALP